MTTTITPAQMRRMHALLRDHGLTGDAAVHAYIASHLGGAAPEHRNDLTTEQAADLIRTLEDPPARLAEPTHLLLTRVSEQVGTVRKSDHNAQQGFNFRGIDAVVRAVWPALVTHRVSVTTRLVSVDYAERQSNRGGLLTVARVVLAVTFVGPAGDPVTTTVAGEAMDSGDKATPKAQSVALRTALLQTLMLPTDDPDPDSFSYRPRDGAPEWEDVISDDPDQDGPATATLLADLDDLARRLGGRTRSEVTAKWRNTVGGLPAGRLPDVRPELIGGLCDSLAAYLAANPDMDADADADDR